MKASDPTTRDVATRDVVFRVHRFDPESGREPYVQDYRVPVPPGMVVLDGLWFIKEHLDPTLVWRASCRMGVCGSCGMMIDGRPTLACNTQVLEVARDGVLELAPLPNFEILRDLVPDLDPMFEHHRQLAPYLVRDDSEEMLEPTGQLRQSPAELVEFLQFSYCIKCGCCVSACPTVATDPAYSGPQALAQAYRYCADSRDGGFTGRLPVLAGEAGPWRCHYAGECSRVCPKGVDPARAIQLLKRELFLDPLRLGKLRRRRPAPVLEAEPRPRREGIPEPPARTVSR
jgi:succinate dehydrogenase / fumarate reductase iron-sulfur subunit